MDQIDYITSIREFEGLTIREICRRTGFHFNTVKKYVDISDWNQVKKQPAQKPSKLDPVKGIIDKWLEDDFKAPRKQRHTAKRVFDRLKAEHNNLLDSSIRTVTRYVTAKKRELYRLTSECSILGESPFGEAQLDFGEVYYYNKDSIMKKGYELVMSFPASNASYVQLCLSQNQECLLEGMQTIFEYIKGVPTVIRFDNMSSAVAKILPEGKRKLVDQFSRFALHHRFKSVFCNPGKGNEKGHVEGKVGYDRRNFMVPVPVIDTIEGFNLNLFKLCDDDMKRNHYKHGIMIGALFLQDQKQLLPLPTNRFKVSQLIKAKTDGYSFINFEKNQYSTRPQYANCEVWIEITGKLIRVLDCDYNELAIHLRHYEKQEKPILDWLVYLPALSRKPNALKYTSFFKTLPDIWQNYFNRSDYANCKNMLRTITPMIMKGQLDIATSALVMAIDNGKDDADSFTACLRYIRETPVNVKEILGTKAPLQTPYVQDFSIYDRLMKSKDRGLN